jgi:anti-sigma factor RsiW
MPLAVTELDLHAYIDGELSPERAAAVEAAMAGDPALAERVRDFQADRQALADTYRRLSDAPVPAALLKAASTPPPGAAPGSLASPLSPPQPWPRAWCSS